jgi:hypothetical protein
MIILLIILLILLLIFRNQKSSFTAVPESNETPFQTQEEVPPHLLDTRNIFQWNAPVNPLMLQAQTLTDPGNSQDTGIELVKIPLQSLDSFRTQDILITPYNKIKYSNTCR